jgi:hypothetical protein
MAKRPNRSQRKRGTSKQTTARAKVQQVRARAAEVNAPFRVVGRVKGGRLQIDKRELARVLANLPKAEIAFVALNAPFKTTASLSPLVETTA